ncbi:MAG: 16S rRNA (adenine(1518)-N(6)/adenine(1519)-N(6))-dimethyltransferase RsmA [Candidatus Paceibacterota bacterium]|jgi:16S rRNA (adenine1518-N6/adenine1519-N6)-dimethyltransferase
MTIQAKKSLGQNFLKNEGVLQKIADAGELSASDIVLEVGPGEGVLTKKLLEKAGKVIAVEKDHRLISVLQEKFASEISEGKFEIFEGDILESDAEKWGIKDGKFKIVANIPYYITGQFFRKFLSGPIKPTRMVILVQKEIAERIVARDGKESLLSISVKAYGEPRIVAKVSKGSFVPAPKVDSAVILIDNISRKRFEGSLGGDTSKLEERFFEILHAGFAHKRKVLISNLREKFSEGIRGKDLQQIFSAIDLDPKIRAEDVSLEKWFSITRQSI